jgi:hypothetical protein
MTFQQHGQPDLIGRRPWSYMPVNFDEEALRFTTCEWETGPSVPWHVPSAHIVWQTATSFFSACAHGAAA